MLLLVSREIEVELRKEIQINVEYQKKKKWWNKYEYE